LKVEKCGLRVAVSAPVTDNEVELNAFYKDFMSFIEYVKNNSPKLTATGNINLKDLAGINECMIRKKNWEEKLGEHIYRIRSENETPYIRTINITAQGMSLCRKFKRKLIFSQAIWKKFSVLPSSARFMLLWESYIRELNWAYIQYMENEAVIAEVLQALQNYIWLMLRDYDISSGYGWISIEHTLETIRKEFNIGWSTAYGDNAELARWAIKTVIFGRLLEVFDFVEIDKKAGKFRLTGIGRKVIKASVPLGWGLGDELVGYA